MSDDHSRPTTIGHELRVLTDAGELAGFIGETKDPPEAGRNFYARPVHDRNLTLGMRWFATQKEAINYLKASL